jgi:hypothetical protein
MSNVQIPHKISHEKQYENPQGGLNYALPKQESQRLHDTHVH